MVIPIPEDIAAKIVFAFCPDGREISEDNLYLKATVNEIRVSDDLLMLKGDNGTIANLVAKDGNIDPNAAVPRFIPEWCALGDSNH